MKINSWQSIIVTMVLYNTSFFCEKEDIFIREATGLNTQNARVMQNASRIARHGMSSSTYQYYFNT